MDEQNKRPWRLVDQPCLVPLIFWTDSEGDRCSIVEDRELDELFIEVVPASQRVH